MTGEAWDVPNKAFNLNDFQLLTPGLYSGDKVSIRINYVVQCFGFWRFAGWKFKIFGELDGLQGLLNDYDIGNYAYRNNAEIIFTGNMPSGRALTGKLVFKGSQLPPFEYSTFAEVNIVIPNLDDLVPPTPPVPPPAICTEGQEKCVGYDRMICQNNTWVLKEANSSKCGYTPAPICTDGDEQCVGTTLQVCIGGKWATKETESARCGYVPPVPPIPPIPPIPPTPPTPSTGIGSWFERNKTIIITVSVVVLVAAIITMLAKRKVIGVRPPITKGGGGGVKGGGE